MESFLIYLGKSALAAGSFYLVYLALFQHQKQFVFNRIYLPVTLAISFLIPLITFTSIQYIQPIPTTEISNSFAYLPEATLLASEVEFVMQWYHYLFGIYLLGIIAFFANLLFGHLKAIKIIRFSRLKELFGAEINVTPTDVHPFSFFNRIVLSEKTLDNPNLEMIVNHEMVHVREKHTLDILFTETLFLLQWFNPFAWLIRDSVRSNLEFLTDDQITKKHNAEAYQLAMVGLAHKKGVAPFLTALNGSQLKNRIIMMKKKTENRYSLLKQLVVLPLLAILVMGLSNKEVRTEFVQAEKEMQIVVDGEKINQNDLESKGVDLSSGFDGLEIMRALGIEDKVILNGFTDETNPNTYFIQTSDYVTGSNSEFDKFIDKPEKEINSTPSKTLVAVDGKILTEEEAKNIDQQDYESVVILSGEHATEKYGEQAKDATVMDLKTGQSNVKIVSNSTVKEKTISGKVTNTKGEPIIAATVVIEGTTTGTITNMEGEYELMVANSDAVLVFSMLGYKFKKVPVSKEEINVMLSRSDIESKQTPYGIAVKHKYLVKGKITNEKGEAVSGATVYIKGTTTGTITDVEGNYVIGSQEEFESLTFAMLGYAKKEVSVSGQKELNVVLKADDSANKDEITVVGYGQPNGDNKESFKITLDKTVENAPLYILDGVPVANATNIDPENIESISVLKGESATKAYGDLGKNGVLLIKSKGKKKFDASNKILIVDGKKFYGDINDIPPQDIASIEIQKKESDVVLKDGEKPQKDKIVINTKTKYNTGGPLIVIDGVKSDKTQLDYDLDPDQIESISVIKDASAVELYGAEAKDGVMLITTKSAGKEMITSELALRKYIAKRIKYPAKAREAGIGGAVTVFAKIDKYGKLSAVGEKAIPDKRIEEIVVTSINPKVKDESGDFKEAFKALEKEGERVIKGIHSILIDDMKNQSVAFTIRFQLEEKN